MSKFYSKNETVVKMCERIGIVPTDSGLSSWLWRRAPMSANWYDMASQKYLHVIRGQKYVYLSASETWERVGACTHVSLEKYPLRYIRLK